jgi:hypothetical protein
LWKSTRGNSSTGIAPSRRRLRLLRRGHQMLDLGVDRFVYER